MRLYAQSAKKKLHIAHPMVSIHQPRRSPPFRARLLAKTWFSTCWLLSRQFLEWSSSKYFIGSSAFSSVGRQPVLVLIARQFCEWVIQPNPELVACEILTGWMPILKLDNTPILWSVASQIPNVWFALNLPGPISCQLVDRASRGPHIMNVEVHLSKPDFPTLFKCESRSPHI